MRYVNEQGEVFQLRIDKSTDIRLEGYIGLWTVIAALFHKGDFYGLLEHNSYGDEAAYQIVKLNPKHSYRNYWIVREGRNPDEGILWIPSQRILTSTYDSLIEALQELDEFVSFTEAELEVLCLSDEQIDEII